MSIEIELFPDFTFWINVDREDRNRVFVNFASSLTNSLVVVRYVSPIVFRMLLFSMHEFYFHTSATYHPY